MRAVCSALQFRASLCIAPPRTSCASLLSHPSSSAVTCYLSPMQSPCHWVLGSFPVPGIRLCYSSFPLAAVSCHQFPEGEDVCSMGRQERRIWEEFLAPRPHGCCPLPWALYCMDTFLWLFLSFLQVPSEVPGERSCKRVQTPLLFWNPRGFPVLPACTWPSAFC